MPVNSNQGEMLDVRVLIVIILCPCSVSGEISSDRKSSRKIIVGDEKLATQQVEDRRTNTPILVVSAEHIHLLSSPD